MSRAVTAARVLLGAILVLIGLNGFFGWFAVPEPSPAGGALLGALGATGYLLWLVLAVEVAAGALLLANRFVPLAAVVLAPVALNIGLYHVFLDPSLPSAAVGGLVFALDAFLLWAYRGHYAPLKRARAVPADRPVPF